MFDKKILHDRLETEILSVTSLGGGDINEVYRIGTPDSVFLLKCNDCQRYPGMFIKEEKGLRLLKKAGLRSPEIVDRFELGGQQFLLMEFIAESHSRKRFWENFAKDLSVLHRNSHRYFGLDHNNYIGSLNQDNQFKNNWRAFFIENRMKPMIKMAFDKGLLNKRHLQSFERFFAAFPELAPTEPPALLHGDLWSGNLLCDSDGQAVFIDPAVYYGHREVDIAMTRMFGGFDPVFLDHYNEHYPLEKGWEKRIQVHNLYPNLVHLNLFGSSYLGNIESTVLKFS